VQASPFVKSKPSGFPQFIKMGNLDVKLPSFDSPVSESPQTRGILKKSYVLREDVFSSVWQDDDQATYEHEEIQRLSVRQCNQSSHIPNASRPPLLLRLILSLVKLIVFGAWEVVSVVLNLITPGVIVPPPKVCCVF
jgi:hypothetical protein